MKKQTSRKNIFQFLLILFIIPVLVTIFLHAIENNSFFLRSEDLFYSSYFSLRGAWEPDNPRCVIVGITYQALKELGEFGTWPRSYHATVINRLVQAGAEQIVFDIVFETANQDAPEEDRAFADAIRNADGKVTLAAEEVYEHTGHGIMTTMALPHEMFLEAGADVASINIYGDQFGIHNLYFPFIQQGDTLFLTLAVRVALKSLGITPGPEDIDLRDDTYHIGELAIPLKPGTWMIPINHLGPAGSIRIFHYDQILSDDGFMILLEKDAFRDRIVFIGAVSPDLQDMYPTAFTQFSGREQTPGVEIHAQMTETILNKKFLSFSLWIVNIFLTFVGTVLAGGCMLRWKPMKTSLLLFLMMVLLIMGAHWLFAYRSLVFPVFILLVAIFTTFVIQSLYYYLTERRARKQIRGYFQHYLTRSVVDELVNNPDLVKLGGEKRVMSVLFSDIAGFTGISETMDEEKLVRFLNEYLTAMTDLVLDYGGILDKYEGDAIMAEFGAPLPQEDHALRACGTALDMQKKLAQLRLKWEKEGKSPIHVRIGINSGTMLVGNMGSKDRFDYTVIGDSVNLASRLEGANKQYQTWIMISEHTYAFVKDHMVTRELDLIRVKGKKQAVRVYELVASADDQESESCNKLLSLFHAGLNAYRNRKFEDAENHFRQALAINTDDGPAKIYLDRCRMFRISAPPDDWDGVFTMKTK